MKLLGEIIPLFNKKVGFGSRGQSRVPDFCSTLTAFKVGAQKSWRAYTSAATTSNKKAGFACY